MTKPLRVSLEAFAHEILVDLPTLIVDHPAGVYFADLQEEYGESTARIMKACQLLASKEQLTIQQAASKAHYVLPKGYKPAVQFIELTELQRRLILFLIDLATKASTRSIQTNYSQLARIMLCSYGGLHTCINRLVALNYLEIVQQSAAGQQNQLILQLTDHLFEQIAPNLDS